MSRYSSTITADRTEVRTGRRRAVKLIKDGGTRPHVGTCEVCGVAVIWHKRCGGASVKLTVDPIPDDEAMQSTEPGRFTIFQGFAVADPDPAHAALLPYYREHACAAAPAKGG